jgi:hypothetical protein
MGQMIMLYFFIIQLADSTNGKNLLVSFFKKVGIHGFWV